MTHHAFFLCKDRGHVQWTAWPVHERVARAIEESSRLIILKSRQLGISWQVAGYAVWLTVFHSSQNVLLLSQGEGEAQDLLGKCAYIVGFLPTWMRPNIGDNSKSDLTFPDLHSGIHALPATAKAGRSEGTNLVVCDEWAFHPYAETNWAALQPTLGEQAKLIGVSTANGRGNFFHQQWQGAENLSNNFRHLFLSCWDAPGRDQAWYDKQVADYSTTPHLLAQEHPRNAAEAFISSGQCVFNIEAIKGYLAQCRKPIETRLNGALKVWSRPVVGRVYVAGADVAEGIDAGNDRLDYSGVAVYDWQTGLHVADLHGQWPTDVFAQHAADLCGTYNNALLGVERNNHGHAVLTTLRTIPYGNLYYHTDTADNLKDKHPNKPTRLAGWPTNQRTKPILEGDFSAAIASGSVASFDDLLWDECLSYVHRGDGKTGAQNGTHDDRVIKHMIAWQMRKYGGRAGNSIVAGTFKMGR